MRAGGIAQSIQIITAFEDGNDPAIGILIS
jgi:hypothetical protein